MQTSKRSILAICLKLFDLCIMLVALATSIMVVEGSNGQYDWSYNVLHIRLKLVNILLLLVCMGIWHIVFLSVGLYDSRRLEGGKGEFHDVFKAVLMGSMLMLAVLGVFQRTHISRDVVLYFATLAFVLTCLARLAMHLVLTWLRLHNRNIRRLLLVGSNPRGLGFAQHVMAKPQLGYRVVGYIDETLPSYHGNAGAATSLPHLGTLQDFDEVLDREQIDQVIMALPIRSFYEEMRSIIEACECQGIQVHLLSDFFQLQIARARASEFDGIPLLTLSANTLAFWPAYLKRAFDLVIAGLLLILLSPVFLLVAFLIKLFSPDGPVFFVQSRVGYNRRRFNMIKFRSMVPNAELLQCELEAMNEATGPVFKIKNDPRITPIGRVLRKTSLDELPQLLNVLRGDMSLVGPRPLPLRDVERFEENSLNRRFSVKPGITCLWQINGRSDLTSFDRWIEQDLEYIDHWSFSLDLKILAKTIPAVLKGTGAH
jgi:exopolysaccharide biosynthesis polyprenyl glycosylphosphotransferase